MLSALKRLFHRSPAPEPAPALTVLPPPESADSTPVPRPKAASRGEPGPDDFPVGGDPLIVPYTAILDLLPAVYHGKLAPAGLAGSHFTIAKAAVLEQLPHGAVKVPLAELKRHVRPGVFTTSREHDQHRVDLPLHYLLRQLRPEEYAPRPARYQLEAPSEIGDVFDTQFRSAARVQVLKKPESSPAPEAAPPSAPAVPAEAPAACQPIPLPTGHSRLRASANPPAASAPPAPAAAPANAVFLLTLDDVAAGWPEVIRQELAQLKVPFAKCALPAAEVCEGLKRGRLRYSWGQLRTHIHPAPVVLFPSPNAETVLDLPLQVVTPLFLDFIRTSAAANKPVDAERITEFFRKAVQNQAPPAAAHGAGTPPAALSAPSAPPADAKETLHLPLNLVSDAWPESVQKEIAQWGLNSGHLEIPFASIEPSLRQGKIEFLWLQIWPWLNPAPPRGHESPYGEARLSMPLPVVAPLFLQQKLKKLKTRTASVPEHIPDLFSAQGTPLIAPPDPAEAAATAPPPPPPAPAPPAETEAPSVPRPVAEASPAPRTVPDPAPPADTEAPPIPPPAAVEPAAAHRPANLAELFGEPNKRRWTPNDIVNKTVQLPGVCGALIALQDGLLVAHSLPAGIKGETVAAFLPQILGRLNQYAGEFQMGRLKSVTLAIEQGTMQIYHPGNIYFAAMGRPDDPLPLDKLDFIAAELDRRSKA